MSAETELTIGELSNAIGISPDTVRYYANEGLLHPKQSAENGYWYYSSDDTVRLTDILFYRSMGLSIKEIKEIINNLPLDRIGRVIGSRKKELINEIKERLDYLYTLQKWDDKYQEEMRNLYKCYIGKMPIEYKFPGYMESGIHFADYMKAGFSLGKFDWGNVSISFRIKIENNKINLKHYVGFNNSIKINPDDVPKEMISFSAPKSIITNVLETDNVMNMLKIIFEYAEKGYELTGEFFGRECTNYFIDGKRRAIYKMYGIIK